MSTSAAAAPPPALAPASEQAAKFPPQIKYIVGNEACERFSFYGMSSILTVHMMAAFGLAEHQSETRYHLFVAACYFTPLLGGFLSDRYWGRYRTILWLSFGYVAGHAVLAAFEGLSGLYTGLGLIALGAGGIKPCVSAFMGDQLTRENERFVDKAYSWFYFSINIGSVSSTVVIPELLTRYGPRVAFGVPGVLMAIALVVYIGGRKHYRRSPPTGVNPNSFSRVVLHALKSKRPAGATHWLDASKGRFPDEAVQGAKAVLGILSVFSTVPIFWSLFFQYGSSWTLQAGKMNTRALGLFNVEASQVSTLNAAFVLALLPLSSYVIFPWLEKRKVSVTPLAKMKVGMFVAVSSFLAAAAVQMSLDAGQQPNVAWQAVQYLLLSIAEVLISVTGLEFAYTQAPASLKSTIMGFWYVAIGVGSLLTATVASLNTFHGATFYFFFAGLMLVAAVAFTLIARTYKPVPFVPASEQGAVTPSA